MFRSELSRADTGLYNAMINGYAVNRMIEPAFALYQEMISSTTGIEPTERTYTALLTACSHTGAVDRARQLLKAMSDRSVVMTQAHQCAFLDVLGRNGQWEEAEKYFLHEMECSKVIRSVYSQLDGGGKSGGAELFTSAEIESCVVPIMTLLSAYRNRVTGTGTGSGSSVSTGGTKGDATASLIADTIRRAERLFDCLCSLAPIYDTHSPVRSASNDRSEIKARDAWASAHVLMSDMYTATDRVEDAGRVLAVMIQRGLKK